MLIHPSFYEWPRRDPCELMVDPDFLLSVKKIGIFIRVIQFTPSMLSAAGVNIILR